MLQTDKDRHSKTEARQRYAMIELHQERLIGLMKQSGIANPIGVLLDVTGTYGRQLQKAWNVHRGMTEAEAEQKIAEMIAYFEQERAFPTTLTVWSWDEAEKLMPLTSPTADQSLSKLKPRLGPGQATVIAIGRHGNSYAIVEMQ